MINNMIEWYNMDSIQQILHAKGATPDQMAMEESYTIKVDGVMDLGIPRIEDVDCLVPVVLPALAQFRSLFLEGVGDEPTVDRDALAGRVGGGVAREVDRRTDDFGRLRQVSHSRSFGDVLVATSPLGVRLGGQRRLGEARADRVHAHRRTVPRGNAGERLQAAFCGGVSGKFGDRERGRESAIWTILPPSISRAKTCVAR